MTAETRTQPVDVQTGEHDRFGHFCWPGGGVGILSTAYCGKVWIPEGFGDKYPPCPTCDEIAAEMWS